jgi:hypothetical protein
LKTKKKKRDSVEQTISTEPTDAERKERKARKRLKREKAKLESEAELVEEVSTALSSTDTERYKTYRYLYKSVKKMVKALNEQAVTDQKVNTRDVYALCTLITQLREIIADMRQLDDASDNINQLVANVLQPYTSSIAQKMLDTFYANQRSVLEYASPKASAKIVEDMKASTKDLGKYVQEQHDLSLVKVNQIFTSN